MRKFSHAQVTQKALELACQAISLHDDEEEDPEVIERELMQQAESLLKKDLLRKKALSKLTLDEADALGLKKEAKE